MISIQELEARLLENKAVQEVEVSGDGYHYAIRVVSDQFNDKRAVARQQWVYALIQDWIADGKLHAVTLQTFTPKEWEQQHG
ncbi:MAG: BolA/IbaG family iron-sulfur metabolism protein [Legionellaceae bacterium]|nr:BolA/IbaG family iron-sulfur metabolism protein [Legionellaceae bacterium]